MIIVSGAAGFIGSCFVGKLNQENYNDIVVSDDFTEQAKEPNLAGKTITQKVDREKLFDFIKENHRFIEMIFHIGARTDTTEFDVEVFDKLNLNYTKTIWHLCVEFGIPLVYASSAATYGNGELGYNDDHAIIPKLKPLNPYGQSKNNFDIWALQQERKPYFWCGLKFFNVYGPNEYHKGRMASVIFHSFNQIKASGNVKLFRSHRPDFEDGKQLRDFIYVKDLCNVLYFFLHHRNDSGIYNLGTGQARSFLDLATNTFEAMNKPVNIQWIDIPEDIRLTYQYFTEANMNKLRSIGYNQEFTSLEAGINDYVSNYLAKNAYL